MIAVVDARSMPNRCCRRTEADELESSYAKVHDVG